MNDNLNKSRVHSLTAAEFRKMFYLLQQIKNEVTHKFVTPDTNNKTYTKQGRRRSKKQKRLFVKYKTSMEMF